MKTDKQYYSWFDASVEQHYQTPPYGIANLNVASSAIEKFLGQNFKDYIEANLRDATEITRKTFEAAQDHKVRLLSLEISTEGTITNASPAAFAPRRTRPEALGRLPVY
jgi:hypothetical protein